MLHQLKAMTMGEPNEALLKELIDQQVPLPIALSRIAALHTASTEVHEPLRGEVVFADEHYFPHPLDVEPLLLFFLQQLHGLWESSTSIEDDLHIATFAMFGVLAIHPFTNGNGRTSQDFAQYLLMRRWELDAPPLQLPKEAYNRLAHAFANQTVHCDGQSPEAFYALRQSLSELFDKTTLASLKQNDSFALVADYLKQTIYIETDED
ncbi:MAG TPA: hypothetical protein DCE42_17810 [Myxococcales bacterium]|nr:hypothetical protein [Deltaproteobacteria bacterium]HAA56625.1 hypothetical protein [Myxococcales bacterium]|tara:strand:- start:3246 stop:3869 length:624 start_codon:yes stop_codon:yes gene_type:complete